MTTVSSLELAALAAELRSIAYENWRGFDAWCGSETGILGDERVRQLGEIANRLGGFEAMQGLAYTAFTDHGQPIDHCCSCALAEVNTRWDRIGDWLA